MRCVRSDVLRLLALVEGHSIRELGTGLAISKKIDESQLKVRDESDEGR